jgi:flavin reductase (DIM6/NTAB) family NADH-FMN oxidoreductase RutF
MSVDDHAFKNALKLWASGVTVVTVQSEDGPRGMTATSFSSVSVEPPQILVCLNRNTDTGAAVLEKLHFGVNILSSEQQNVSNEFAGGSSQEQRFANVTWSPGSHGAPLLTDALVSLECKLVNYVEAGTHWIVIAEVQSVDCKNAAPLIYYNADYRALALD